MAGFIGPNRVVAASTANNSEGGVTLTTSSATVVASNDARVEVTICNTHATQTVYLSLGGTAVSGQGIFLPAAGGSYTTSAYTGVITGIASGADTVVSFSEV